ncbi:MAG: transposase, partial [Treponema sp.]|nr:transposase [Treponema sp.]
PDATTLLNFRHVLEQYGLPKQLFERVNKGLEEQEKIMGGGSILDATHIEAPGSTKNGAKSRDPEMLQGKKGPEWHFGMKAPRGVDGGSGMVHRERTTAVNVHDEEAGTLIREDDEFVNPVGSTVLMQQWSKRIRTCMELKNRARGE